jgi:hypothetical protein
VAPLVAVVLTVLPSVCVTTQVVWKDSPASSAASARWVTR